MNGRVPDWSEFSNIKLAALRYAWRLWWARPEQIINAEGLRTHGILAGRGFGKTKAHCEAIREMVEAGELRRIGLLAQNEPECLKVLATGESGLITISPPWFRAKLVGGAIVWPNGAIAYLYTAEKPGPIRGNEHDCFLCTEAIVWPATQRAEVLKNIRYSTRIGRALIFWDTTPKRKHPIVKEWLAQHRKDPERHQVVNGTTDDNAVNLTDDFIQDIDDLYGGTEIEKEERFGIFSDEDGGLWQQTWIDRSRSDVVGRLLRRVIAIDPAISMREGTDATGIIDMGLGVDGDAYLLGDLSGRIPWEEWVRIAVDHYLHNNCDCFVVERNRGGDAIVAALRAEAKPRDVKVELLPFDGVSSARDDVIYVKEVVGRSSKESRAQPIAALTERGRIHFTRQFEELEDQLTVWEPGEKSPNALDAFVWSGWELFALGVDVRDNNAGMQALGKIREEMSKTKVPAMPSIADLRRGRGRSGARI